EAVAPRHTQLASLTPAAPHQPRAEREPFDPVGAHQVGEAADAEPVGLEPGERVAPGDLLDLRAHALEVVLPHRFGHRLHRLGQRLPPWKRVALGLGAERDFVPLEPAPPEPASAPRRTACPRCAARRSPWAAPATPRREPRVRET